MGMGIKNQFLLFLSPLREFLWTFVLSMGCPIPKSILFQRFSLYTKNLVPVTLKSHGFMNGLGFLSPEIPWGFSGHLGEIFPP